MFMKNNTYVNTRSKLARMGLCQQQEETVDVKEQVHPEKSCHGGMASPVDPEDTILKLHQRLLTCYNQKLDHSTFSPSVVLGGVYKSGIVSWD